VSTDPPVPAPPALRIVRGTPSAEELAALVIVLTAAGDGDAGQEGPPRSVPQWATPGRLLRRPVAPTGWWESSLPR
jgi:hypothetical protein